MHCYRILGSTQDAEDALQETLLSAWQALGTFEERASIRTWLYRIATNRCLNMLRAASRRPKSQLPPFDDGLPDPTRIGEAVWLQPYPDMLLEGLPDDSPGPEARYEMKESVSLAFVTALQLLPPRQRVVLVLRDVLGLRAHEAAEMLDSTEASVTNALTRALGQPCTPASATPGIASLPPPRIRPLNRTSSPASPLHTNVRMWTSSSASSPMTCG